VDRRGEVCGLLSVDDVAVVDVELDAEMGSNAVAVEIASDSAAGGRMTLGPPSTLALSPSLVGNSTERSSALGARVRRRSVGSLLKTFRTKCCSCSPSGSCFASWPQRLSTIGEHGETYSECTTSTSRRSSSSVLSPVWYLKPRNVRCRRARGSGLSTR